MFNFGFNFGRLSGSYPPVKEHLILWADGTLIDGADVWQDPDEVQDPNEPEGVWRKDKSRSDVQSDMQVSHSHCCTFDGVGTYIELTGVRPTGSYSFSCSVDLSAVGSRTIAILGAGNSNDGWYLMVNDTSSLRFNGNVSGSTTSFNLDIGGTSGRHDIVLTLTNVSGNSYDVTLTVDSVYSTSVVMPIDDPTLDMALGTNAARTSNFVVGAIWDVTVGNVHYPMSEGYGLLIHSSDGLHIGTITGSVWDFYQDDYHYNVWNGFWMNGDGVKYPCPITGFTSVHPAGKWNQSESKYVYRDESELIAADALEGPFLNVPRTEAEMVAYYADKASASFGCKGHLQYDIVLTGEDLFDMLKYNCKAEAVTVDGEVLTVDGETVYVRI